MLDPRAVICRFCGETFWNLDYRCPVRKNGFSHVALQKKDQETIDALIEEGFSERDIYKLVCDLPDSWSPAAELTGHTDKGFLSVHLRR